MSEVVAAETAAPKVVIGSHLTRDYKEDTRPSGFICGSCSSVNHVTLGEPTVHCKECGYRIMYKVRQRRPLEYIAR